MQRLKQTSIMLAVAVSFVMMHYYFFTTPVPALFEIRLIILAAVSGLCLFGTLFLLFNSQGIPSRKVFAFEMGMVALASLGTVILLLSKGNPPPARALIPPSSLLYGNIYAYIMMLYPFALLRPSWMTFKHNLYLFLPALGTGLFYYLYIRIGGVKMTEVYTWSELLANIHKFDIWFRFTIFIYPIWTISMMWREKRKYQRWCETHFSNPAYTDLNWLNYYLFGYLLIDISYMFVIMGHHPQSNTVHYLGFLCFFGFALYKILQQETPTLKNSQGVSVALEFDSVQNEIELKEAIYEENSKDNELEGAEAERYRFEDKISRYKIDLERWMVEESPYRDKDFKLLDVMQVLPLNRSYLSRLFNEGYGESFFNFVMRYRLDESMRLLEQNQQLPIGRIAEMCGFSSPSVFGRAFLKNRGITPKQYRMQLEAITKVETSSK